MPALLFWLLVVALILFFHLTTRAQRGNMVATFWIVILALGALGFLYQLLTQGTLSY
ncbi:hypothetical protein RCH27_08580 [Paracidovorax citrulli]|uniref:hypothetical protein n=1 Tax=Paracidovorax citrulli TaxID=80869 RepID=UPI003A8045AC